jgi:hypothetical protein
MLRRARFPLVLALCLLTATAALAEAPSLLPVSGWLADTDGAPLDGDVDLTIALYADAIGGTALFTDTVTVTVDLGFFVAYAGENAPLDLALFAEEGEFWLGLAVDEEDEMEPRARVATAPWAGWAEYAGLADDALALGGVEAADYQLAADDADTLVDLGCLDGQIVVYDGDVGAWFCGDVAASTETDPVFAVSDAAGIAAGDISDWGTAVGWGDHGAAGYLTSYTETDPVYGAAPASGIAADDISSWNTAVGWGDHGAVGYLTSYTETDPVYGAAPASGIAAGDISSWNTAVGWGDHGAAGYLTSYTETDPVYGAAPASGIAAGDISSWNTAVGWGDHGAVGYLTSYTETDPVYGAAPASSIAAGDISSWNTAVGWGDHGAVGYLTSYTETDPVYGAAPASGIGAGEISAWNTAWGWGDHSAAGYLTSYTETDPVYAAAPASGIGAGDISSWNTAVGWGNHSLGFSLTGGSLETNGRNWALSASMAHSPDDITGFSTLSGDDNTVLYQMPFTVRVDGTDYEWLCISTNGWVSFETSSSGLCTPQPGYDKLPTAVFGGPAVAAYWTDLVTEAANIRYGFTGQPFGGETVIIDYEAHVSSNGLPVRFQIQIHEFSNLINVEYRDIHYGAAGQGATIGFQLWGTMSGGRAYQVGYQGKVLDDNQPSQSWSVAPIR